MLRVVGFFADFFVGFFAAWSLNIKYIFKSSAHKYTFKSIQVKQTHTFSNKSRSLQISLRISLQVSLEFRV